MTNVPASKVIAEIQRPEPGVNPSFRTHADAVVCNRNIVQRLVARGFATPAEASRPPVTVYDEFVSGTADQAAEPGIAIFLPTMTSRLRNDGVDDFARGLVDQARVAGREGGGALHLYVTVQYAGDEGQARLALTRLIDVLAKARDESGIRLGLTGIICSGTGKVRSLNVMTAIARQRGVGAAILIDDDVSFSDGCFARLIDVYRAAAPPVAIGARKIGRPFATRSSRLLHTMKSFTQPVENYPHACCMIVSLEVISPEIPPPYSSDDGYICFQLMRPEQPDPLVALRLAKGAACYHLVGARSRKAIFSRIRRMLLHHHLFLSHFDAQKAAFYLKELLFFGLWPLVPFDRSKGLRAGMLKCLVKYIYAIWFLKVGVELVGRGMTGQPLGDIDWGEDPQGAE